jgi:ATP-dependent RNA helicase DeaD
MAFPSINKALDRALAEQGYSEPTPVQSAVLADEAAGRDLLVSAQTGSGKTVAFGLAMAPAIMGEAEKLTGGGAPLALIIAPTRELAMQVTRELTWLYAGAGARIVSCVGGMDPRSEHRALLAGCHIVVGTPGRLRDHIDRGRLDVSALEVVVLDEADEMLDLGFREDLEAILDTTPAERRTLLFSATIAREIATLARRYQRDALRIDTIRRDEPHGDIEYRAIRIAPNDIEHAVVNVLRFFEAPGALVFCSTREAVRHLYGSLRERGFSAVALSGELSQKERSDALQSLRDGHARVCVATDVAARGLDLPDLGLVIHADLPVNKAGLLHRSGRTGRAGRKGISVLLVPYPRRRRTEQLLDSAQIKAVWAGPPTADEIRAKDQVRLLEDPLLAETPAEDELALARLVLEKRSPEEVASALIRLYRSRLPAPEDLYDAPPPPARDEQRGERQPAWQRDRDMRTPRDPSQERDQDGPRKEWTPLTDTSWFRLAIGRSNDADPKWLIPLICRLGHVTKKDIGQIRIFDRETKFEIASEAAAKFTAAVAASTDDRNKIEPAGAPAPRKEGPKREGFKREFTPRTDADKPRKPFAGKPHGKPHSGKPAAGKPWAAKPKPGKGKPNQHKS